MREILLNRGFVALVDDEDYEKLNKYKWHIHIGSTGIIYAKRNQQKRFGEYLEKKDRRNVYMHREIMNVPDRIIIDHIDTDGLNNQKENLRISDQSLNQINQRPLRGTTSRFKGVSKISSIYRARITVNGECIYLGSFQNEEEAALAYNQAAAEYYGELARLNEVGY